MYVCVCIYIYDVKGNEFVHAAAPTEIYHEIRNSVYSYIRSN